MRQGLTIGIPTYNREDALIRQLERLFSQDLTNVEEIIVIDNDSNYNVEDLITKFNTKKIKLIKNPFNIRMGTNMISPFYYCTTEWLWLLSDDDEVHEDSIYTIWGEITASSASTGLIKFSIDGRSSNKITVETLPQFIDYYSSSVVPRGDLVFISTNVFNIRNLRPFLGYGYEYSYTYIGFLIPVLLGLNNKSISVTFTSKQCVNYIPPEVLNSFNQIGKGLSTLSHISWNLNNNEKRKLYSCIMIIDYKTLFHTCLNSPSSMLSQNLGDFDLIYHNIYKHYLPIKTKLLIKIFCGVLSLKYFAKISVPMFVLSQNAYRQIRKVIRFLSNVN